MPRKKQTTEQQNLLDVTATLRTAVCVPLIRQEVEQWRNAKYKGITDTTRRLFKFWFETEHRLPNGLTFFYYTAQREAIETLVYLYEVKKIRRRGDLLLEYAKGHKITLPPNDDFARYALKVATRSGKTKVMALVVAWQYFNALQESADDYAANSLLIASNIIVLERLALDFKDGKIFKTDPIIPPDLKIFWDFDVYFRGDAERATSEGALYLTNIQQLYEREEETDKPDNPIDALLGQKPPANLQQAESFIDRIARRGNCLVLNDEAHHTNDDAVAWNKVITDLHERLVQSYAFRRDDDREKKIAVQSYSSELQFRVTPLGVMTIEKRKSQFRVTVQSYAFRRDDDREKKIAVQSYAFRRDDDREKKIAPKGATLNNISEQYRA
jgi:type III restriction enzyme